MAKFAELFHVEAASMSLAHLGSSYTVLVGVVLTLPQAKRIRARPFTHCGALQQPACGQGLAPSVYEFLRAAFVPRTELTAP